MEAITRKSAPCLVFQHGRRDRSQTFFDIAGGSYYMRSIRQIRKKDVWLSFQGWLLLRDTPGRFCLFDPISFTKIEVPHLTKVHRDCISILSTTPGEPSCQLILIETMIPSPAIYYCRIAEDKEFNEARLNLNDSNESIYKAISCKGKIYFLSFQRRFGVIDIDNRRPIMRFLDVEKLDVSAYYHGSPEDFLVEFGGEIFVVSQIFNWEKHMVSDILVFKMDFCKKMWVQVKTIGDHVFFLSNNGSYMCPALELGIKGNQIFFFLEDDISLYSYHMKERSISVDLIPNVQPPWKIPFWVIQTGSKVKAGMEKIGPTYLHVKVEMEKLQRLNSNEKAHIVNMVEKTIGEKKSIDEKPWSDLPQEIVMLIATCLTPVSYARMRSICYNWRSIVPPAWLPQTPCLLYHDGIDGLYKFFDPLSNRVYAANIPELHGATLHCSKDNWLVASYDEKAAFFFNPFTKERINLPNSHFDACHYPTVSFSSVPTSLDCIVFSISNYSPFNHVSISTCTPKAKSWHTYERMEVYPRFHVSSTSPVFHNGLFYCLGLQGNLGIYNVSENNWKVLKKPKPLQLPTGRCFLTKYEEELIFVYTRCTQIKIFRLDQSKMEWVEVEGLDDLTLFLSAPSSPAMIVHKEAMGANRDMRNKIYTSRFRRDSHDAVIFSIESKPYHLDFYESKEFTHCTWIDPTGYKFGLDSHNNILNVTNRFR